METKGRAVGSVLTVPDLERAPSTESGPGESTRHLSIFYSICSLLVRAWEDMWAICLCTQLEGLRGKGLLKEGARVSDKWQEQSTLEEKELQGTEHGKGEKGLGGLRFWVRSENIGEEGGDRRGWG